MSNTSDSDALATRPAFTQGELVTHIGQDGGVFIRDKESHRLIAGFQTSTMNERMPEGEGEANAALFMASRDMLAALKAVNSLFVEPSPFIIRKVGSPITNGDQKLIDDAFIALDAAISKAERGQ